MAGLDLQHIVGIRPKGQCERRVEVPLPDEYTAELAQVVDSAVRRRRLRMHGL